MYCGLGRFCFRVRFRVHFCYYRLKKFFILASSPALYKKTGTATAVPALLVRVTGLEPKSNNNKTVYFKRFDECCVNFCVKYATASPL